MSSKDARQLEPDEHSAFRMAFAQALRLDSTMAGADEDTSIVDAFMKGRSGGIALSTQRPIHDFGRRLVEAIKGCVGLQRINQNICLVIHGFNNKIDIIRKRPGDIANAGPGDWR